MVVSNGGSRPSVWFGLGVGRVGGICTSGGGWVGGSNMGATIALNKHI